eukprot:gene23333-30581_t
MLAGMKVGGYVVSATVGFNQDSPIQDCSAGNQQSVREFLADFMTFPQENVTSTCAMARRLTRRLLQVDPDCPIVLQMFLDFELSADADVEQFKSDLAEAISAMGNQCFNPETGFGIETELLVSSQDTDVDGALLSCNDAEAAALAMLQSAMGITPTSSSCSLVEVPNDGNEETRSLTPSSPGTASRDLVLPLTPPSDDGGSDHFPLWAIILIAVLGALSCCCCWGFGFFWWKKKKKKQKQEQEEEEEAKKQAFRSENEAHGDIPRGKAAVLVDTTPPSDKHDADRTASSGNEPVVAAAVVHDKVESVDPSEVSAVAHDEVEAPVVLGTVQLVVHDEAGHHRDHGQPLFSSLQQRVPGSLTAASFDEPLPHSRPSARSGLATSLSPSESISMAQPPMQYTNWAGSGSSAGTAAHSHAPSLQDELESARVVPLPILTSMPGILPSASMMWRDDHFQVGETQSKMRILSENGAEWVREAKDTRSSTNPGIKTRMSAAPRVARVSHSRANHSSMPSFFDSLAEQGLQSHKSVDADNSSLFQRRGTGEIAMPKPFVAPPREEEERPTVEKTFWHQFLKGDKKAQAGAPNCPMVCFGARYPLPLSFSFDRLAMQIKSRSESHSQGKEGDKPTERPGLRSHHSAHSIPIERPSLPGNNPGPPSLPARSSYNPAPCNPTPASLTARYSHNPASKTKPRPVGTSYLPSPPTSRQGANKPNGKPGAWFQSPPGSASTSTASSRATSSTGGRHKFNRPDHAPELSDTDETEIEVISLSQPSFKRHAIIIARRLSGSSNDISRVNPIGIAGFSISTAVYQAAQNPTSSWNMALTLPVGIIITGVVVTLCIRIRLQTEPRPTVSETKVC